MAYSVYSLRISNDLPVQADYVPRITFFFTLSVIISLLVLAWFVHFNSIKSKDHLPKFYEILLNLIQKIKCKKSNNLITIQSSDNKSSVIETGSSKTIDKKEEAKKRLEIQIEILNNIVFCFFSVLTFLNFFVTFFIP